MSSAGLRPKKEEGETEVRVELDGFRRGTWHARLALQTKARVARLGREERGRKEKGKEATCHLERDSDTIGRLGEAEGEKNMRKRKEKKLKFAPGKERREWYSERC